MSLIHQSTAFLRHWLYKYGRHSLHSPFIYSLYEEVIRPSAVPVADDPVEAFRNYLKTSSETINASTFGAPSRGGNGLRTIADLAVSGSSPARTGRLLELLVSKFECRTAWELGTSLGLTTLYLSRPAGVQVTTFEGNADLSERAKAHFRKFGRRNVEVVTGNLDVTLAKKVSEGMAPDLVYLDANHRYSKTMDYMHVLTRGNQGGLICVLDDIHWSPEMTKAWMELVEWPMVRVSADLYFTGLLFIDEALEKQHYILEW